MGKKTNKSNKPSISEKKNSASQIGRSQVFLALEECPKADLRLGSKRAKLMGLFNGISCGQSGYGIYISNFI